MKYVAGQILTIVLYGTGLLAVCLLIWLAGPMLAIGPWRPLDNDLTRGLIACVLLFAGLGFGGYLLWSRARRSEAIEAGIAGDKREAESDEKVLAAKMKDALATLKAGGGDKASYLYDLPWYVIIGPPGSGKTTALVNSGLKFPLSRGASPAAIAGSGGTRYCDWWFAEDAVLIDTAGRYTTQDSDAKADARSWLAFLDLLKSNRPRQPINGVIVAISLEDLLVSSPEEVRAHGDAIRSRLLELHQRLKVDFPVYALFTKADLVAGFSEFFGGFNQKNREQVWGATFQTQDKKRNMIAEIPTAFDELLLRLNDFTTDRLQEEPTPSTRVALFAFPVQMATLRRTVHDFLNRIFEPTHYHATAMLRGFYFTSGTQQGTPIDQLIGSLERNFGAREVKPQRYSGLGKSYFLTNLIGRMIIGEANWVSTDAAAVRRARLVKVAAYGVLAVLGASCVGAWSVSFTRNKRLIGDADVAAAGFMSEGATLARQTRISDADLKPVLPLLNKLRVLPAGYAEHGKSVPRSETYGLSQRDRIGATAVNEYRLGLERMFRPRLIYGLEDYLERNRTKPSDIYDAFKVYRMLTASAHRDRNLVVNWMRQDWALHYPGAGYEDGRQALESHLNAMFDLDDGHDPLVKPNDSLVVEVQRSLARLNVVERAYALLKSQSHAASTPDWVPAQACGEDFGEVFEAAKGELAGKIRVPGFFTYAGFRRAFLDRLSGVQEQLERERWVLGPAGEQTGVAAQYQTLAQDLRVLYTKEFIATWQAALAALKLKSMVAEKPNYKQLSIAASAANSPLKCLLEQIRAETAVTKERADFKTDDKAKKAGELAPVSDDGRAPGVEIETAFRAFTSLVEGGATQRPIDTVVAALADIHRSLIRASNPAQAAQATSILPSQVEALRQHALTLPAPLSAMLQGAAADFDADLTSGTLGQLRIALGNEVTGICKDIIGNRYPFTKTDRDVALNDFGRLFALGGIIDRFFTSRLTPYVDMSKREWAWRQDTAVGKALSAQPATLRDFQRAAQIRESYLAGGGLPNLTLTITPPPLPSPSASVATPMFGAPPVPLSYKMDVNGTPVVSTPAPVAAVVVSWPGLNRNSSAVIVSGDAGPPAILEKTGPWSIFRLVEAGSPVSRGDRVQVNYLVGGKELTYLIGSGSARNPFNLSLLRDFQCPARL